MKPQSMPRQFLALFLVIIAFLNACGTNPGVRVGSSTQPQSSESVLSPVVVPLLGLPDASAVEDASRIPSDAPLFVPNNQNGELIVPLRQDASAPFNGVLFNGPAVARVSVEFRAEQQRCRIERAHDVGLVVARYNADVDSLNLALDTQQRTSQVLLSGRDQDIARLNRLLTSQTNASSGPHIGEGLIWASGGLLVGVVVVGGIVIFANAR